MLGERFGQKRGASRVLLLVDCHLPLFSPGNPVYVRLVCHTSNLTASSDASAVYSQAFPAVDGPIWLFTAIDDRMRGLEKIQ